MLAIPRTRASRTLQLGLSQAKRLGQFSSQLDGQRRRTEWLIPQPSVGLNRTLSKCLHLIVGNTFLRDLRYSLFVRCAVVNVPPGSGLYKRLAASKQNTCILCGNLRMTNVLIGNARSKRLTIIRE